MNIEKFDKDITCFKENIEDFIFDEIFEFNIKDKKEDICKLLEPLNYKGIYLIEIKYANQSFLKWIKVFEKAYLDKKFKTNSPKLIQKRINIFLNKEKEINNWLPLYIGKSENIKTRLNTHLFYKLSQSTYALKLFKRTNMKNYSFKIKTINLNHIINDSTILPIIEKDLRNKLNPIIGKD